LLPLQPLESDLKAIPRFVNIVGHFYPGTAVYRLDIVVRMEALQIVIIEKIKRLWIEIAISLLGWFLSVAYITLRIVEKTITIGDYTMYVQAVTSTQALFRNLLAELSTLYSNSLFINNLFEFLSLPAHDFHKGKEWVDPINEIEFRDVSFCYPGSNKKILEDVNFKIQRGKTLAIVGKNGAGKTTLVKLICRLYKPTSGEIIVDGKNMADFSPYSIQEQISVLFQDHGNYYLTARENIGIGKIESLDDMHWIQIAARRSGASETIDGLSRQYETTLGKWFEDGAELSGGQWQKVALARGFMRRRSVLVLDEPTTHLDAESESKIVQDLATNNQDQITFLISHRLSVARIADQIILLDGGKCVEAGSHQELMGESGVYARLFMLQSRGYDIDTSCLGA